MNKLASLDWIGYFNSLSNDEMCELAAWLATERLGVGEFMEVVDRVYAQASETSDEWRGQPPVFVAWFGRTGAREYARRKRRFVELMDLLEEARLTGAMPGDVAPDELELPDAPRLHRTEARSVEHVLAALDVARRDAETAE